MGSAPSKKKEPVKQQKPRSAPVAAHTRKKEQQAPSNEMPGAAGPSRGHARFEEKEMTPREGLSRESKKSKPKSGAGQRKIWQFANKANLWRMTSFILGRKLEDSTDNAPDADFHGLIGGMMRQKTMMNMQREKTRIDAVTPKYDVRLTPLHIPYPLR